MVSVTNADPDRIRRLLDEFAQDVRTAAAPGPVHPQRPAFGGLSPVRPRAAVALRALLPSDLREGRGPTARTRSAAATSSRRPSIRCGSRWASTRRGWPTGSTSSERGTEKVGLDVMAARELNRGHSGSTASTGWTKITRVHKAGARWILDLGPPATS